MAQIIIKSNELENVAAKISTLEAQAEGILSVLQYDKNIPSAENLAYILADYSKILTDQLYDLIEKAPEVQGGGRYKWVGKLNRCGVAA